MKITYNTKNISRINQNARLALIDTSEAIKTDIIQSQTMPFDTGTMQNDSTFTDTKSNKKNCVKIVVDTHYARKVYFDPELHIKRVKNPNAKQYYFDDYINGIKKDLPIKYFKQMLKRRNG